MVIGTGKSTTIRAVADLLPALKVADDPFNSQLLILNDEETIAQELKMERMFKNTRKFQWLTYH